MNQTKQLAIYILFIYFYEDWVANLASIVFEI